MSFIQNLFNALDAGGKLVVKTPHARNSETLFNPLILLSYWKQAMKHNGFMRSLTAVFKRFWHCDPPRHIYSFSKNSLTQLMGRVDGEFISSIKYYEVPLFKNTLNEAFFKVRTNSNRFITISTY